MDKRHRRRVRGQLSKGGLNFFLLFLQQLLNRATSYVLSSYVTENFQIKLAEHC